MVNQNGDDGLGYSELDFLQPFFRKSIFLAFEHLAMFFL